MFTRIATIPAVFAYRFEGEITASDVDEIYDELLAGLDEHDKISVYAEVLGEFDMNGDAVWRDMTRAHEMFGHFRQFDRIAFVAAPSWITTIAKLEESLLAFFDFEMHVFDPSEGDYALAWVKGEKDEKDASSVRELPSEDPGIAIFEIDGKIRKRDLEVSKQILRRFQDDSEPRKLMAVIKRFTGFEIALLADRELFKMKLEAAKHLDRYAFVGAPDWLKGYIETMDGLLDTEIRTFDTDERADAIAWLREDELVS
ncbi:STAS/SEC14 domain-containing protein [Altererythrobacter sp. MF3-039]|uniref:STAS/SEC14 domain-containing protein n=1 Tax=Altererythrobacter sp. MF3-039 TaxID=3252901 RepID=UPI00390C6871